MEERISLKEAIEMIDVKIMQLVEQFPAVTEMYPHQLLILTKSNIEHIIK